MLKFLNSTKANALQINSQDQTKNVDKELINNLEILMNLDTLEEADSWPELINLSDLDDAEKNKAESENNNE
ncbi:hypothetical protein K2P97_08435 [bacterium]|nr:hypothetical protein [bacterium]